MTDIVDWYEGLVASELLLADKRQRDTVLLLQDFTKRLSQPPKKRSFFSAHSAATGIYLYGGVGRGKTLLMDGFYMHLPLKKKWRIHFHAFMRHFHQGMQHHDMKNLAADIAEKYRLLCFDEFHVADIADAMILTGLLRELLRLEVSFVMTSNYPPRELYPDGLARHLFLPAIALIEERFQLVDLSGEEDYRQRQLRQEGLYFFPADERAQAALETFFDRIACNIFLSPRVSVQGREIQAIKRSSAAIWFDFRVLCGGHYSATDYLHLAERFKSIFLSAVPRLDERAMSAVARRFTWLVDILYDKKVNIVMSAAAPLERLYGTQQGGESGRTLSRLQEMQSESYAKPTPARKFPT